MSIPTKDGWYFCRHTNGGYEIGQLFAHEGHQHWNGYGTPIKEDAEYRSCTFTLINPPPDDGKKYACVWVEVTDGT